MLHWKPANTAAATLAVQRALRDWPDAMPSDQLYFFVTKEDCATELGRDPDMLMGADLKDLFAALGLPEGQVYSLAIPGAKTVGVFVPQEAFKGTSFELPDWDSPWPKRLTNRGRATTGRS